MKCALVHIERNMLKYLWPRINDAIKKVFDGVHPPYINPLSGQGDYYLYIVSSGEIGVDMAEMAKKLIWEKDDEDEVVEI